MAATMYVKDLADLEWWTNGKTECGEEKTCHNGVEETAWKHCPLLCSSAIPGLAVGSECSELVG